MMTNKRNGPGAPASAAEAKGNNTDRSFSPNFSREQAAAHPVAWGDNLAPCQPTLRKWTPRRSGALLGFASVELLSGMIVNELRIMTGKRGPWVAMPAQRQTDKDGRPRLDANGKPIYAQMIEFRDRATADRFGRTILDLVQRHQPEVFDAEPPGAAVR
jgi:DNA-binding cell septation regulator SpoVG